MINLKTRWIIFYVIIIPVYFLVWKFNHEIFLAINGLFEPFLAYPMILLSAAADGLFVLMISAALFKKEKGYYWSFLLSYVITTIIVQIVKNTYTSGRPLKYYSTDEIYYAGELLRYQSFPSGHSSAAMVLARYLIQGIKNVRIQIIIMILGIGCAISRVYIGAHFPIDVITGGLIGFFITHSIFFYAAKKAPHATRPEYRFSSLIISIIGLGASFFYILFSRHQYAPISLPVTMIAGVFGFYFIFLTLSESMKVYRKIKEKSL